MAKAKEPIIPAARRWEAIVPINPTISEEGMKWVDEKVREYGYVIGLAVILEAEDEYELANIVRDLSDEIHSSGYATAGPIERPRVIRA